MAALDFLFAAHDSNQSLDQIRHLTGGMQLMLTMFRAVAHHLEEFV